MIFSFQIFLCLLTCSECFVFHGLKTPLSSSVCSRRTCGNGLGRRKGGNLQLEHNTASVHVMLRATTAHDDSLSSIEVCERIDALKEELIEVKEDLKDVAHEISLCRSPDEKAQLMDKEARLGIKRYKLMEKVAELRIEKNKLMDKEAELRIEKKLIDMKAQLQIPEASPALHSLDMSTLLLSSYDKKFSTFMTAEWLSNAVNEAVVGFNKYDTNAERVPLMAVVCCNRGGKTRALKEIASMLATKQPNVTLLFVSFNGITSLNGWEQRDPIGALCRRIAFAARPHPTLLHMTEEWEDFKFANVSSTQIMDWLGDRPCILLIDELNNLDRLSGKLDWNELNESYRCHPVRSFASFLRDEFLLTTNRYLIFSSSYVSTTSELSLFMDWSHPRGSNIIEPPLIPNLRSAVECLGCTGLTAAEAIYYGLIPALIFTRESSAGIVQDRVWDECKDRGCDNWDSLKRILRSISTGDKSDVPTPFHCLMNTGRNGILRWIPFHLDFVLKRYANALNSHVLFQMSELLTDLKRSKVKSGAAAWESMFVFTIMARALCSNFRNVLLPLSLDSFNGCSVSLDHFYVNPYRDLSMCTNMSQLLLGVTKPRTLPHIAFYYLRDGCCEECDLVAAAYDRNGHLTLYKHQMKEGDGENRPEAFERIQTAENLHCDAGFISFDENKFVVCGDANKGQTTLNGWVKPSKDELTDFYGESGRYWTPEACRILET